MRQRGEVNGTRNDLVGHINHVSKSPDGTTVLICISAYSIGKYQHTRRRVPPRAEVLRIEQIERCKNFGFWQILRTFC